MVPPPGELENEQVTQRHMLRHACGYLPDNRQAPESYLLVLFGFAKSIAKNHLQIAQIQNTVPPQN